MKPSSVSVNGKKVYVYDTRNEPHIYAFKPHGKEISKFAYEEHPAVRVLDINWK